MAEVFDDFKISNVEIINPLGINLTSDISRIKHTGVTELNISSRGEVHITTEDRTVSSDQDNDIVITAGDGIFTGRDGGDIRLTSGNGHDDGGEIEITAGNGRDNGGYISIVAGDSNVDNITNNEDGGYIDIIAGDAYGSNSYGGQINIYAGDDYSTSNGSGGDIYIESGYSENGSGGGVYLNGGYGQTNGGPIYIQGGYKNSNNGNNGSSVNIKGGDANGNVKGGNVVIYGGYGASSYGDIIISGGPTQKIGFYGNTPVIRPASSGETAGFFTPGGGANIRHDTTYTGNLGDKAYTISDIVKALKQLGLLDTYLAAPGAEPLATVMEPRTRVLRKTNKEINHQRIQENDE